MNSQGTVKVNEPNRDFGTLNQRPFNRSNKLLERSQTVSALIPPSRLSFHKFNDGSRAIVDLNNYDSIDKLGPYYDIDINQAWGPVALKEAKNNKYCLKILHDKRLFLLSMSIEDIPEYREIGEAFYDLIDQFDLDSREEVMEAAGLYIQLSKLLDDVRLQLVYASDLKTKLARKLKDA